MTVRRIANIVCKKYDISTSELVTKTRKINIVEPRQITQYFATKYTNETLSKIGNFKNAKFSHATVLHSKKKVLDICEFDKSFKRLIDDLDVLITKAK